MAKIKTIYGDPTSPLVANLFGTGVKWSNKYGWQQTGPSHGDYGPEGSWNDWGGTDVFADTLFDKDAMGDISEYLSTP